MKSKITVLTIIIVGLISAGVLLWYQYRGVKPALFPWAGNEIANNLPTPEETNQNSVTSPQVLAPENKTKIPLTLPNNFSISVFAGNVPGARVMAIDGIGNLWVSQTSQGTVSLLEIGESGLVKSQQVVFSGLNKPHGLSVDPSDGLTLYIAEEDKISRVRLYSEGTLEKIIDLPAGGRHFTRTLGFGPDGRLYVSIGSSCDVCYEDDPLRAAIYSLDPDGSDFKVYATGLRNSVFFRWSAVGGRMWATEMGRDYLGDNLPPDEVNVFEGPSTSSGQNSVVPNFGWPVCYGNNIHDTNFDKNVYIQNPCNGKIPAKVELQAHSAPLGLDFIAENSNWPTDYWHNLIVAYHGSWNRTVPTGYKLVRIKLDAKGNLLGIEDFITGWQAGNFDPIGRPVDVLFRPGGVMYVSDDKAGAIYRITYKNN